MQSKATMELRSRLRLYPLGKIATLANLDIHTVEAVINGDEDPSLEVMIRLTGAEVALRRMQDGNDCDCPGCRMARQNSKPQAKSPVPKQGVIVFIQSGRNSGFLRRLARLFS